MSDQLYPDLPGLAWPVTRAPQWKTTVQTTPSLREFRTSSVLNPVHELTLKYEFLRQRANLPEFQRLFDFYASHRGDFDTFLFNDKTDNTVALQRLAVGTGAVSQFQLGRWLTDTPYNIATSTEDLSVSPSWALQGLSTVGSTAAYDGLQYATQLAEDTSTGLHRIRSNTGTFNPALSLLWSVDVKAGTRTDVVLALLDGDNTSNVGIRFNLLTGVATQQFIAGSASVAGFYMEPLGNGWFRCSVVATAGANNALAGQQCQVRLALTDGTTSYTGAGAGSYVFVARPMMMPTTLPKPYVRNTSSAALYPRLEPVYAPIGALTFFSGTFGTGWSSITPTSVSSTGLVTLSAPLAAGSTLLWSGSYYWRCRFADPNLSIEQFMSRFWQLGRVKLRTWKP